MSYLRGQINTCDEPCDKCSKPMTLDRRGVELCGYTKEQGKFVIWVHLDCLQKVIASAIKERESKEQAA